MSRGGPQAVAFGLVLVACATAGMMEANLWMGAAVTGGLILGAGGLVWASNHLEGGNYMSITAETQREAYYESREEAETRRKLVYQTLRQGGPMTVDELVGTLIRCGKLRSYDRNYVAPRLTELKEAGLVETDGKRMSWRSKKMTAVWRAVEVSR